MSFDEAWDAWTHELCTGEEEWSFHEDCMCDRCWTQKEDA